MRGLSPLLALAAGLALAGPAGAVDHPIGFRSYVYDPAAVTIAVNDTVTFTGQNGQDFADHPLVWSGGVPATTSTGSSKQFTQFTHPGTYSYYCQLHVNTQNMRGTITIVDQHPANVSFSVSPAAPRAGQPVTFTYTGDPDPDGTLSSWQWDVDGDGAFETSTPSGAVTTTYATPGTVTVRMRAIDDSGEASATAEQAVTIAPAAGTSGSGGSAGSGSASPGSKDTTAPRATLVKLSGLKLSFRSSEKASATATLRARGKTIARGSAKARSGAISIRLRLTSAGRTLLPRGHKLRATLKLTLRDAGGNRRSVTKTLTVKRAQ